MFSTYNAGAVLGSLLGGYVGEHYGLRFSFFAAGFFLLISTFIIFRIKSQPVEPYEPECLEIISFWPFILFISIIFFATYFMFLPQPLSQNFLQNERNLTLSQIGSLISVRSAGVVFFNLILETFCSDFVVNPRL